MTAMTDEGDDKVGGAGGGEIKDESAISAIASLLSINNCWEQHNYNIGPQGQ